jgi:hypothetical protein
MLSFPSVLILFPRESIGSTGLAGTFVGNGFSVKDFPIKYVKDLWCFPSNLSLVNVL